jgi:hypothetical protein
VDPERLTRWFDGFVERHGAIAVDAGPDELRVRAFDGSIAECHSPPGAAMARDLEDLVALARTDRRIGLLLARRGGVAIGVAAGTVLESSKVDTRYVQGRTAAGGWSQHRFARRRENQARAAAGDAADIVARLLVPAAPRLAALVTGGDRRTVDAILADPRLASVAALRDERFLAVAEPRLATLEAAVRQARTVLIRLTEPDLEADPPS